MSPRLDAMGFAHAAHSFSSKFAFSHRLSESIFGPKYSLAPILRISVCTPFDATFLSVASSGHSPLGSYPEATSLLGMALLSGRRIRKTPSGTLMPSPGVPRRLEFPFGLLESSRFAGTPMKTFSRAPECSQKAGG